MRTSFKAIFYALFSLMLAVSSDRAFAAAHGYTTPTSLTMTIVSAALMFADGSGSSRIVWNGSQAATFKRADGDLKAVTLSSLSLPQGRYSGIVLNASPNFQVSLNGTVYSGINQTKFTNGNTIYTNGADATVAGSLATSLTGASAVNSAVTITSPMTAFATYFPKPYCIYSDASKCSAGDVVVNPSQNSIDLFIVWDLFNAIGIDAIGGAIDNSAGMSFWTTPSVFVGKPGAIVHLNNTGGAANMSLIFDGSKNLIWVKAGSGANGVATSYCIGSSFSIGAISAAPAGATFFKTYTTGGTALNFAMPMAVSLTGGGSIQYSNTQFSGGVSSSAAGGGGTQLITGFMGGIDATVSVTCGPDSGANPAFLGYTYSNPGPGITGGATTLKVARIVDPGNILGMCAAGTCSSATLAPNAGYP